MFCSICEPFLTLCCDIDDSPLSQPALIKVPEEACSNIMYFDTQLLCGQLDDNYYTSTFS